LPYHISKISFCKKFAEGNDNYEFINEDETLKKKEMKIHKSKSRSKGKFTRTKSKLNNKNNTNNKNNNNNKNNINNNNENENIINIIQRKNQELQIQRIPSDECIIY
jgi:predicted ATPase